MLAASGLESQEFVVGLLLKITHCSNESAMKAVSSTDAINNYQASAPQQQQRRCTHGLSPASELHSGDWVRWAPRPSVMPAV